MSNSCNPMDCNLPGSSLHGILQARILEWVAISFSRESSQPRNRTWVSWIAESFFTDWLQGKPICIYIVGHKKKKKKKNELQKELLLYEFYLLTFPILFSHCHSCLRTIIGTLSWASLPLSGSPHFLNRTLTGRSTQQIYLILGPMLALGVPRWLSRQESTCQHRRLWFDPWAGKIAEEGNGNPLQYSCLEKPMDRGAWQGS